VLPTTWHCPQPDPSKSRAYCRKGMAGLPITLAPQGFGQANLVAPNNYDLGRGGSPSSFPLPASARKAELVEVRLAGVGGVDGTDSRTAVED
jgi:hypothetical protein